MTTCPKTSNRPSSNRYALSQLRIASSKASLTSPISLEASEILGLRSITDARKIFILVFSDADLEVESVWAEGEVEDKIISKTNTHALKRSL